MHLLDETVCWAMDGAMYGATIRAIKAHLPWRLPKKRFCVLGNVWCNVWCNIKSTPALEIAQNVSGAIFGAENGTETFWDTLESNFWYRNDFGTLLRQLEGQKRFWHDPQCTNQMLVQRGYK